MDEYVVVWAIEVSATSELEAAKIALEIQRDVNSSAVVFEVKKSNNKRSVKPIVIDLNEL